MEHGSFSLAGKLPLQHAPTCNETFEMQARDVDVFLTAVSEVAVVEVWGGASASYVSLEARRRVPTFEERPCAMLAKHLGGGDAIALQSTPVGGFVSGLQRTKCSRQQ